MAARTGVYSLLKAAKNMCRLILAFEYVLIKVFPGETGLHTAVTNAATACHALRLELEDVVDYGT